MTAPHPTARRSLAIVSCLLLLSACGMVGNDATDFPSETVHLVVPYSAGGGIDTITRGVAQHLPDHIGQTVVVENWEGAAGRVAAARFQGLDGDGHYLYSDVLPSLSIGELVFDGQHTTSDWVPLYGYSDEASALMVREDDDRFPDFDAFVELAQTGDLDEGSPGLGLPIHLQSEVLQDALDLDYTMVPFDGTSGAFGALLGENADFVIGNIQNFFQYEDLRVLAVLGEERDERLPDVPTAAELGYDVPSVPFSRGFFGPPGLTDDHKQVLESALADVIADEDWRTFAEENGVLIVEMDSDEFANAVEQGQQLTEQYADLLAED